MYVCVLTTEEEDRLAIQKLRTKTKTKTKKKEAKICVCTDN